MQPLCILLSTGKRNGWALSNDQYSSWSIWKPHLALIAWQWGWFAHNCRNQARWWDNVLPFIHNRQVLVNNSHAHLGMLALNFALTSSRSFVPFMFVPLAMCTALISTKHVLWHETITQWFTGGKVQLLSGFCLYTRIGFPPTTKLITSNMSTYLNPHGCSFLVCQLLNHLDA